MQELTNSKRIKLYKMDGWYDIWRGVGTLILAVIYNPKTKKRLLRQENCPPHNGPKGYCNTIITGLCEDGETPYGGMIREVEEESGIKLDENDKIELLVSGFTNKNSDNYIRIYYIETEKEIGEIKGDGTYGESIAKTFWTDDILLLNSVQYIYFQMILLFKKTS